jgi:hypothetical protein
MMVSGLLLVVFSAGCASNGSNEQLASSSKSTARDPSWTKYYVAGSRIPRQVDAQGQPITGTQVITITDEQLQNSSGMLLGEKLGNGYSR